MYRKELSLARRLRILSLKVPGCNLDFFRDLCDLYSKVTFPKNHDKLKNKSMLQPGEINESMRKIRARLSSLRYTCSLSWSSDSVKRYDYSSIELLVLCAQRDKLDECYPKPSR